MAISKIDLLRKRVFEALELTYDEANDIAKRQELHLFTSIHKDKYYRDLIFQTSESAKALEDIVVEIEFVETKDQHDLWETFRARTSSIAYHKNIGRHIRILVKDKTTQKYLGIIALSSDFGDYIARDAFIGWTRHTRYSEKKLNYVMNIICCVGLQPVAFNYNIGKLLVAICYSQEVHDYIFSKYGHYIACITTMSLNGKSIQYDRMRPYLQLVGYTKGTGTIKINDTLYKECVELLKDINDVDTISKISKRGKLNVIYKVLEILDIDTALLNHGRQRGCYLGFVGSNAKEFLRGEMPSFNQENIKTLTAIVEWWKDRWARKRFNHLLKNGGLKYKIVLLNYKNLYNSVKQKKYVIKKRELIGEEEYKKLKSSYISNYRKVVKTEEHAIALQINDIYLKCFELISPEYLAGFIDGDGSIYYGRNGINVSVLQCSPKILLHLYKQFGGNIRSIDNKKKDGFKRNSYLWSINGSTCIPFLEYIHGHVIIDCDKVTLALEWFKTSDTTQRNELGCKIRLLDKNTNNIKDYSKVNIKYIAGLFDAEGCVAFNLKGTKQVPNRAIYITQKCDQRLLESVKNLFECGSVNKTRYTVYGKDSIALILTSILPYLVVKQQETLWALDELKETNKSSSTSLFEKITNYKHQQHDINTFVPIKLVNNSKNRAPKIIPKHQIDKIRERMTGDKNPNSGGMSHIHRLHISNAQKQNALKKRKYSDELIIKVRQLSENKNRTRKSIADELKLDHRVVSAMIGMKIKTVPEIINSLNNIDKSKYDAKPQKRIFSPENVVRILQYKKSNPNLTLQQIADNSENIVGVTINLTTLRNWVYGKINIKESLFPINGLSYDDYQNIKM